MAPDDPRHGTVNGYGNLKCRCERCRAAWARACRIRFNDRARVGLTPDDPRHGRESTYTNYGCRCDACSEARAAYYVELRERRKAAA